MSSLVILLLVFLVGWFWLDSLRAREMACGICKETCERLGVQLLDQTVALQRIGTGRNTAGHLQLLRTYHFEFTDTGAQRNTGVISLVGIDLVRLVVGANIIR